MLKKIKAGSLAEAKNRLYGYRSFEEGAQMSGESSVFLVTHVHESSPDVEEVKMLGTYPSEKEALAAVERAKSLPEFAATPQGFQVCAYILGKDDPPLSFDRKATRVSLFRRRGGDD